MPGAVLCDECRERLPVIAPAEACPRCGAPYGRIVCTECWRQEWAFEAALALGEFEAPLARAVALHKDAGERRLAAVFGVLLAEHVRETWPGWADAVAFIPATDAALRRRGFDHGRGIGTAFAAALGVPVIEALARAAARDQRTLGRAARAANIAGTFEVSPTARGSLPPHLLLVDDVMTTGATVDAAAAELLDGGADAVRVAAVARTW